MTGSIVHLDLGVTDLTEGVKFYKQVFPDWDIEKAEGMPDYYFAIPKDGDNNLSVGIGLVDEITSSGSIVFYVNVGDIPTAIKRVTKAGGRVLMEKTALGGDHGFISRFEDPFGNLIGIWSQT